MLRWVTWSGPNCLQDLSADRTQARSRSANLSKRTSSLFCRPMLPAPTLQSRFEFVRLQHARSHTLTQRLPRWWVKLPLSTLAEDAAALRNRGVGQTSLADSLPNLPNTNGKLAPLLQKRDQKSATRGIAETDFGQTDFGHPYLTDFGQSDFGQTDFGQKNLTDFGQP